MLAPTSAMLSPMIAALHALAATPERSLPFAALLRTTGFDRRTLRLVFEAFESAGIVQQTGYTRLLGEIRGYRLLRPLDAVSLLEVADALAPMSPETEELPRSTAGAARYDEARRAYRRALAAIPISEF